MPAILDDPTAPTIYRVSGEAPYPDPANPALPPTIVPRHVTLRDRQTVATVVPFASRHQVPESLLRYLSDQFNKEIEGGDTYPMMDPLSFDKFSAYWFQNFAGIMLLGNIESPADVVDGKDWSAECLGTFYIKPNYPGRSSHICNAGFIVTDAARNRGVGRLMGEAYLDWAPKLGYTYSVFNLVYETNVASCKIWDALGFKRIGRVKNAGNLKSYPDRLVDAIIYGRDLGDAAGGSGNEELVSEERFDKIKFYLKYGRYPNGADRAEKSRLRSAATHYKLLDGDVLMLKDKEVISDAQRQYDIARGVHNQAHAGINKTTATIAERYHWSRIKETVSDVIRNCTECKETGKASWSSQMAQAQVHAQAQAQAQAQSQQSSPGNTSCIGAKRPNLHPPAGSFSSKRSSPSPTLSGAAGVESVAVLPRSLPPSVPSLSEPSHISPFSVSSHPHFSNDPGGTHLAIIPSPSSSLQVNAPSSSIADHDSITRHGHGHNPMLQDASHAHDALHSPSHSHSHQAHHHHHVSGVHTHIALPPLSDSHSVPVSVYQPIDPQIISQPAPRQRSPSSASDPHHHHHAQPQSQTHTQHAHPHALHHHTPQHHHHHHDNQPSPQHQHHYSFDDHHHASPSHHPPHHHHHHDPHGHVDPDADTFQALLHAAEDDAGVDDAVGVVGVGVGVDVDVDVDVLDVDVGVEGHDRHNNNGQSQTQSQSQQRHSIDNDHPNSHKGSAAPTPEPSGGRSAAEVEAEEQAAVDRDLEMLIEPQDDEDDEDEEENSEENSQTAGATTTSATVTTATVVAGLKRSRQDSESTPSHSSGRGVHLGPGGGGGGGGGSSSEMDIDSIVDGVTPSSSKRSSTVAAPGNGGNGKMDVSHLLSTHHDESRAT